MLTQQLDIKNCIEYLQGEYFTNIKFETEEKGCYFFYADDEDGQRKHIQFDPIFEPDRICVAVFDEVSMNWHIYDILED